MRRPAGTLTVERGTPPVAHQPGTWWRYAVTLAKNGAQVTGYTEGTRKAAEQKARDVLESLRRLSEPMEGIWRNFRVSNRIPDNRRTHFDLLPR